MKQADGGQKEPKKYEYGGSYGVLKFVSSNVV